MTSTSAVQGHLRLRSWQRLSRGLYVPRSVADDALLLDRLRAWQLLLPDSAGFTHLTAAAIRGWWLPSPLPVTVFAAMPEVGLRFRRPGLVVTRHPVPPPWSWWSGLRVVTPAEVLLHAARDLALLDLVVLGDSALRLGHVTIPELHRVAKPRRRGAPRLRSLIPLLDRRSESPWESILRTLHRAAGIPVTPQATIYAADDGHFVARADLRVVGTRRLPEYDGDGHRDSDRHRDDLRRDRELGREGWERAGYTRSDVLDGGAGIIADADRALGRPYSPAQLAAWNAMIAESLHSRTGRTRVWRRWIRR